MVHVHKPGEDPRAQLRVVFSPDSLQRSEYLSLAGRDFRRTRRPKKAKEPVAIVSETLAKAHVPQSRCRSADTSIGRIRCCNSLPGESTPAPRNRIIGVTADIDDQHVVPEPIRHVSTVPLKKVPFFGGRPFFIHTSANPYFAGHPPVHGAIISRTCRLISPLNTRCQLSKDVRAEVLTPGPF